MTYKLKLDMFEGPLDLLLYLIKKDDIDIYDIPIAKVTEQYLEYIEMMKMLDLEIVGEFLVMAATLIQIKSKMLLPPDPSEVAEEDLDPRDELVRRLLEYKKFKEVAEDLKLKESARQDLFIRNPDPAKTQELIEDAKEVFYEVSLFDLITSLSKMLSQAKESPTYDIKQEEYTVEEKIHDILHLMVSRTKVKFTELFSKATSKSEIIVTFMAILELIRLKEIVALQNALFDEIEIVGNREKMVPVNPH